MKKFLAMAVITGLATLFVACDDKKEEKAPAQAPAAQEEAKPAEAPAATDNATEAQNESKEAVEATNTEEAKPAEAPVATDNATEAQDKASK